MAEDRGSPTAGNRRIDRVLAADFLDGLATLPLAQLRARRAEAEQEEADLSYLRRLLQGRIDILRAERARRDAGGASLVERLPSILADERPASPRGLGRHTAVTPSRTDAHRRHVESLVADVELSDASALTAEGLAATLRLLEGEEQAVSQRRSAVQRVVDACTAELARRYRDGEADVDRLLAES